MAAEKSLRRRRKAEEEEEEKVVELFELFNLPNRRQHFQDTIGELSELVEKYLVKGATEKSPGLSYFAYFFANLPSTRHEAHWQMQSFVLLEILHELRMLRTAYENNSRSG